MRLFACIFFILLNCLAANTLLAQHTVEVDGFLMKAYIIDGDTILFANNLDEISVTSKRSWASNEEYLRYLKYKRYAVVVYPYAVEAVALYNKMEEDTEGLSRRKKKKYIRRLKRDYKPEYKDKLKNLTRTQGRILIEMIEREVGQPLYDIVKETQGGLSASFYQSMGTFYDYDLKEQYQEGQDPIMDIVLKDMPIKYESRDAAAED